MQKRIKALFASLLLGAIFALAQGGDAAGSAVKVVHVHGNAQSIANAAGAYSGAHYMVSQELNAIVVRGTPDQVASVERTIEQLDAMNSAPTTRSATSKSLELTVYVIGGAQQPIEGADEISGEGLASVVKQLRAVFPYQHYALLSSMLLRSTQDSGASSNGMMRAMNAQRPANYNVSFKKADVSQENPPVIKLSGFHFDSRVPIVIGNSSLPSDFVTGEISVETHVDVREGQKVVVGKVNASNSDNCYFLVLSARLVP